MAAFAAGSCHCDGMPLADFVHLRMHSAYSLSAGAIKIKELVKLCRADSMPAVAITDTGNLFGALEFAIACTDAGIQPIIGIEIALAPGETTRERAPRPVNGHAVEPDRIVLLVQSETGYRNLIRLTSRAYLDGEAGAEPTVTLADLAAANEGLICLAGGAGGPIGAAACRGTDRCRRSGAARAENGFSGPALHRIAAARHAGGGAQRSRAGRSRLCARPAAGRDQQRLFPGPRLLRGA